ncbi:hypothetical protein J7L85_03270 [candidate division WOR-3 bacterium]|nr:hypothetical protein [candidate division WOR-3 bacterium]
MSECKQLIEEIEKIYSALALAEKIKNIAIELEIFSFNIESLLIQLEKELSNKAKDKLFSAYQLRCLEPKKA